MEKRQEVNLMVSRLVVSKSSSTKRNTWKRYEIEVTFPQGCTSEVLEKTKQGLEEMINAWIRPTRKVEDE